MVAQPGQIANIVPTRTDPGAIMRMIRDMQADIKALQGALTLNSLTIGGGGTITVDGELVVTGDTVIDGTLSLPNASVTNDALVSPVASTAINGSATGLSVASGSYVTAVTETITVPAGFTQADIIAIGIGSGSAPTGGGGALLTHVTIAGIAGADGIGFVGTASAACGSSGANAQIVTGLIGGGTVVVSVQVGGAGVGTWTNIAGRLSGLVTWQR